MASPSTGRRKTAELIDLYRGMGEYMQELTAKEERIKVYSWETPAVTHAEVSRLIAKLRDRLNKLFGITLDEDAFGVQ